MSDEPPPVAPRRLDRHFRWRGTSVSRLEGFSDSVFAIVLALLFLRSAPPENYSDLRAAMKSLAPFAITFAIVAYVWIEHWLFTRRYDLRDGLATFLNLLLLFLLLGYAYPLKYLFTFVCVQMFGPIGSLTAETMAVGWAGAGDSKAVFAFYGVGYGAIFLTLALLYWRALRLREELGLDAVETHLTRTGIVQLLVQVLVAAVSVTLAVAGIGLDSGAPGWIYASIGPLMMLHGMWEGRGLRRLRGG